MRRRLWFRVGELIFIKPWVFLDEKAILCMRYTKTQSLYLSRKGALPEIVDLFGLSEEKTNLEEEDNPDDFDDEIQETVDPPEELIEKLEDSPATSNDEDDIDSFFG